MYIQEFHISNIGHGTTQTDSNILSILSIYFFVLSLPFHYYSAQLTTGYTNLDDKHRQIIN
jgi:hypothetical protein